MRSTSHIATSAGIAPDIAICQLATPTVSRVSTTSRDEFQPAPPRLIQTYVMRFALVMLVVAVVSARAEAGRGVASLKYLPDDTNVVMATDVARSRNSQMFKKLFKLARDQVAWLDTLASTQPVEKQIDTIVIGATPGKTAVVVLEGRIDKLLAETKKQATSTEVHEGITYWVTADGEIAVIDKKLVFASPGTMTAVIDRAKDKKAKGPGAVRTIMAAATPTSAVFGGALLDSAMKSQLDKSLGSEPQWMSFSCGMAQKLALDVRLKFADEAGAATAAKSINDQLTPERRGQVESFVGKEFSESLTVEQQKSFAKISATLTSEEVEKVVSVAKMVM
jgi:hypothetical protein